MQPFTAARENSSILRLPAGLRTAALNKLSANANAPGGCKRQNNGAGSIQPNGRAQQAAARNIRNALGIYLIESNQTGPYAYSVGGATPETITLEGGTPATTPVATNELDAVTFVAPQGTRSMTVQTGSSLAGNAKVAVGP